MLLLLQLEEDICVLPDIACVFPDACDDSTTRSVDIGHQSDLRAVDPDMTNAALFFGMSDSVQGIVERFGDVQSA